MAEHTPCLVCSSPPQRVDNWRKWSVGEMAVHPLRVMKYPGENKQALESQAWSTEGRGKHRWEKQGKGDWKVLSLWNQRRETEMSLRLGGWETCLEVPRSAKEHSHTEKNLWLFGIHLHMTTFRPITPVLSNSESSSYCHSRAVCVDQMLGPTSSTRSRQRQELLFFF